MYALHDGASAKGRVHSGHFYQRGSIYGVPLIRRPLFTSAVYNAYGAGTDANAIYFALTVPMYLMLGNLSGTLHVRFPFGSKQKPCV